LIYLQSDTNTTYRNVQNFIYLPLDGLRQVGRGTSRCNPNLKQYSNFAADYRSFDIDLKYNYCNWQSGSKTQRFNTANTKAHHWTRSGIISIHLPFLQSISL